MTECDKPCAMCCKYSEPKPMEAAVQRPPVCEEAAGGGEGANREELRPVPAAGPACYLPQAGDVPGAHPNEPMGPVGPWATGRVDWGPLAGLTGTRPVVSSYSVTRYSEAEWRLRNAKVLNESEMDRVNCAGTSHAARQCLERVRIDTDRAQATNTCRITQRANDIHRWRSELRQAIADTTIELELLQEQLTRLKNSMSILTIPEAIAAECLAVRCTRLEPDLVRDEVEEELIRERALTAELRETFQRILNDVADAIREEQVAKQRLESDWSDKQTAHDVESGNAALNNRSGNIMFQAGSTRLPADQSTPEYWQHFTRESLMQSEAARQRAVALRGTLDAILTNAARDLRTQADRVDAALAARIACVEELRARLESELNTILQQLVDTEQLIERLKEAIRQMDFPLKVAHSRLNNKIYLPRVENCREESHMGLVTEVKTIGDDVAALSAQLHQAEECKAKLLLTRGTLEREIMIKLKNLWLEKDRIQRIRSHYPSATALSGY